MTGNDVSKLVSLLVLYKYLDKQESGLKKYTASVKKAVFTFQRDAGLPATGVCDKQTVKTIQERGSAIAKEREKKADSSESDKSSAKGNKLGERAIKPGDSGADVNQLIELLKKKGFLEKTAECASYDETVRNAVRRCQTKFGLEITGIADPKTIRALQALKDE